MPTTRMMASKIPSPDAPLEALMQHSWEQITNTCPFNITHHPAISIPCGLGEGDRPIGLMLIAKHWQEATLYRAADAFERAANWQTIGTNGPQEIARHGVPRGFATAHSRSKRKGCGPSSQSPGNAAKRSGGLWIIRRVAAESYNILQTPQIGAACIPAA